MIVDRNLNIINVNQSVIKATALSGQAVIGQSCFEIFHGMKQPPKECPHSRMLKSRHPETMDMQVEAINRTFLVTVAPVFNDHGQLCQTLHLANDITESKKMNRFGMNKSGF